ncbi:MAG: hypothetical protein R2771_12480 [Saprospiraceae bacterium]
MKIAHQFTNDELYDKVIMTFKNPVIIIIYEIGIIALFMHLKHGFQSAFQTLGSTTISGLL